jgi:hypothetical protein
MGFFDRLFGTNTDDTPQQQPAPARRDGRTEDEIAVERYRYLLRTARPSRSSHPSSANCCSPS